MQHVEVKYSETFLLGMNIDKIHMFNCSMLVESVIIINVKFTMYNEISVIILVCLFGLGRAIASGVQESPTHGPGGDTPGSPGVPGVPGGGDREGGVLAGHCLRAPVQEEPVMMILVNINTNHLPPAPATDLIILVWPRLLAWWRAVRPAVLGELR